MAMSKERSVCVELAIEGERLCKSGDCRAGVQYFEEAARLGTDDLKTLSAIYSQLGNAYFYLQEYGKALEYHNHDRTLARSTGDKVSEAKASGNLANTLKMLGKFDEAVVCCCRHLEISREFNDKIGEARALYNLGSVYHTQGKQGLSARAMDRQQHPEEAVTLMRKAIGYYEENLVIVKELGDRAALGRAYGSLGNTNYLLGNYRDAIRYHRERLAIAKEFGDKSAERRAYSNLGNAHVLLGEYEAAADFYKRMLNLAKQLKDRAIEAQACYSLGNTYTLLGEYEEAIEYHMRHLQIAQELKDRVGECKACWSLSNAHLSLGNTEQAVEFTKKQLAIASEVGDVTAETAESNLRELMNAMGREKGKKEDGDKKNKRIRRTSMENMEILRLTPDQTKAMATAKASKERSQSTSNKALFRDVRPKNSSMGHGSRPGEDLVDSKDVTIPTENQRISPDLLEDDNFFDLISRLQGRRMNDQRCEMRDDNYALPDFLRPNEPQGAVGGQEGPNDNELQNHQINNMISMLENSQSRRLNEQRVSLEGLPGLRVNGANVFHHPAPDVMLRPRLGNGSLRSENRHSLDDTFFNALMRCQGTRLNDQRSSPPIFDEPIRPTPTLPDEDFFALIIRMQSSRIEDQRCRFRPEQRPPTPDIEEVPPQDDEIAE